MLHGKFEMGIVLLKCNVIGRIKVNYSTLNPVSLWMCDQVAIQACSHHLPRLTQPSAFSRMENELPVRRHWCCLGKHGWSSLTFGMTATKLVCLPLLWCCVPVKMSIYFLSFRTSCRWDWRHFVFSLSIHPCVCAQCPPRQRRSPTSLPSISSWIIQSQVSLLKWFLVHRLSNSCKRRDLQAWRFCFITFTAWSLSSCGWSGELSHCGVFCVQIPATCMCGVRIDQHALASVMSSTCSSLTKWVHCLHLSLILPSMVKCVDTHVVSLTHF